MALQNPIGVFYVGIFFIFYAVINLFTNEFFKHYRAIVTNSPSMNTYVCLYVILEYAGNTASDNIIRIPPVRYGTVRYRYGRIISFFCIQRKQIEANFFFCQNITNLSKKARQFYLAEGFVNIISYYCQRKHHGR